MTEQEIKKRCRRNKAEDLENHAGMGEIRPVWFWNRMGKGLIFSVGTMCQELTGIR